MTLERLLALHQEAAATDSLAAALDVVVRVLREGWGASWAVAVVRDELSGDLLGSAGDGELLPVAESLEVRTVDGPASRAFAPLLAAGGAERATVVALGDAGYVAIAAVVDPDEALLLGDAVRSEVRRALRHERERRRATHDVATGLPGPLLLDEVLRAAPDTDEVGLLLVSVEQLQAVTRSFGPAVGSELLRKVAARLLLLGSGGSVFRLPRGLGVLTVGPAGTAASAAEQVMASMAEPWVLGRRQVRSTCRIGIAVRGAGQLGAALVEQAEAALDVAASRPRPAAVLYTPELATTAHEGLVLETLLHAGLARGELVLRFQPQVDIATGAVLGAEALVRWQRPGGLVPPDRFIPAAEITGLIVDVDTWVLRQACEQARSWPGVRIAVNVSSRTLAAPGFAAGVLAVVDECGIPADQLEVEITESLELFEGDHAVTELAALRARGVHVALDDFGTGYSNVGRLRHLPIDRVKIDQAFVRDIGTSGAGAICDVIVGLAKTLDLDVIAEGVETEEQRDYLRALGCPEFQGYLRSAPVPAEAFAALLS